MLTGLKEIYVGIPDQCVFVLYATFAGTVVRLDGVKASAQYGFVRASSYADAANVTYSVLNNVWVKK